jgi:hypothetical protein
MSLENLKDVYIREFGESQERTENVKNVYKKSGERHECIE